MLDETHETSFLTAGSLSIIALLVWLTLGCHALALTQQPGTPSAALGAGACFIPKENPVSLRLREGKKVWVTCVNSEIVVLIMRSTDTDRDRKLDRLQKPAQDSLYLQITAASPSSDGKSANAVWPIAPEPQECWAGRRSPSRVTPIGPQLLATPPPGLALSGQPSPLDLESGLPVSPPIVAAVILVLREATACAADGDVTRLGALFANEISMSDRFGSFTQDLPGEKAAGGSSAAGATPSIDATLSANVAELGTGNAQRFTVSSVRQLRDGRVIALTDRTASNGERNKSMTVFVRVGDLFLIADEIELPSSATPEP